MKLVNGIWQKYANPVRSRFILFKNRRELRRVKKSFFKNNFLSDNLSDKFVKSFPRTLGNFIGGNELLQNEHGSEIKKFLLERIEKDFVYYSEKYIREFLKEQYDEISLYLESEGDSWSNCYVSSILNKDTSTNNSSRELLSTFREVNELPRNATITLEKYFQHENDYYEIREGYRDKISKNPYNIYLKKKLNNEEKKYKSKKFELSSKLHDEMKSKKYFIFIDDFSGSGATIKNFFEIMNDYFDSDIKIIIICIHMMQTAENKLRKYFDDSKYKTLSRLCLLTHDRKRSLAYNKDEQYKSVVFNRALPSLYIKLDEQES